MVAPGAQASTFWPGLLSSGMTSPLSTPSTTTGNKPATSRVPTAGQSADDIRRVRGQLSQGSDPRINKVLVGSELSRWSCRELMLALGIGLGPPGALLMTLPPGSARSLA